MDILNTTSFIQLLSLTKEAWLLFSPSSLVGANSVHYWKHSRYRLSVCSTCYTADCLIDFLFIRQDW